METEHISLDEIEILDPIGARPRQSFGQKYGPAMFWTAMVAMPILNFTASVLDWRTAKINLEIEHLREAAEAAAEVAAETTQ